MEGSRVRICSFYSAKISKVTKIVYSMVYISSKSVTYEHMIIVWIPIIINAITRQDGSFSFLGILLLYGLI